MIFIHSPGRSGSTWVMNVLNSFGLNIVNEPFSTWHFDNYPGIDTIFHEHNFGEAVLEYAFNSSSSFDRQINTLEEMFKYLNTLVEHTGAKFIDLPWLPVLKYLYPDCKQLIITRQLEGRLVSYNRWIHKGGWRGLPGGFKKGKKFLPDYLLSTIELIENEVEKKLVDIAKCTVYNEFKQNAMISSPCEKLVVAYEDLVANYDIMWTKLLNYCGIEIDDLDKCLPNICSKNNINANEGEFSMDELLGLAEQLRELINFGISLEQ